MSKKAKRMRNLGKREVFWMLLTLTLALQLIAIMPDTVHAAFTKLIVFPPMNFAEPGTDVIIEVRIQNVSYLDGYDVTIVFDPTILYTQEDWVFDGGWLKTFGETGGVFVKYTEYSNNIKVTDSITEPGKWADGSGKLFSITFNVHDPGKTSLRIDTETTELWDKEIPAIPIDYEAEDSVFFTNTPRADFEYTYTDMDLRDPIEDQTITFNATYDPATGKGSYDPDNLFIDPSPDPLSYNWDFDDGTIVDSGNNPVITHNYTDRGTYAVALTVTDDEDKTDTYSMSINIAFYDIAITNVKANVTAARPGSPVAINVTVANHPSATLSVSFNLTLYYNWYNETEGIWYNNTLVWYNETEGKSDFSLPLEKDPEPPYNPPHPPVAPGESLEVAYIWNTTGVPDETYIITANASILASPSRPAPFLEDVEDETNNQGKTSIVISSKFNNILIKNIDVEKTVIALGEGPTTIWVQVRNEGNIREETFSVALYYDSTLIENQTGITLATETSTTLTFTWHTEELTKDTYNIKAIASQVPDEIDYEDNSLTYEESIIISDAPIASFTYEPAEPKIYDDVTFDASPSYDPDGIITQYSWGFGDGGRGEGKTIKHRYFSVDTFTVTLNVTDNATITTTYTEQVTIGKAVSNISISLAQTTITFGDSVIINGTLIKPIRNEANITLQYSVEGETTWNNITVLLTNTTSQFISSPWTPHAAGTYEIRATWPGDAAYVTAQSPTIELTVEKIDSTISIAVSEEKVTVGSNIVISGKITPTKPDVTVTIHLQLPNGTWNQIEITTDSSGEYSYDWTPSQEGTYQIKTSWSGDQNTSPAESDLETVIVEPAAFLDLVYIGIGIAILAAAAIAAIYFLKIKKP